MTDAADSNTTPVTEAKRAPAANFLPINRGRLPLIFVHAARFDPTILKMSNKDAATAFSTSVGKIFDIRKGRNFGYITEGWKPTQDDLTSARAWIDSVGSTNAKGVVSSGNQRAMEEVLNNYTARGLASDEEAQAQAAARAALRAKPEGVGAGPGDNTQGASAAEANAAITGQATAEDPKPKKQRAKAEPKGEAEPKVVTAAAADDLLG